MPCFDFFCRLNCWHLDWVLSCTGSLKMFLSFVPAQHCIQLFLLTDVGRVATNRVRGHGVTPLLLTVGQDRMQELQTSKTEWALFSAASRHSIFRGLGYFSGTWFWDNGVFGSTSMPPQRLGFVRS